MVFQVQSLSVVGGRMMKSQCIGQCVNIRYPTVAPGRSTYRVSANAILKIFD